MCRSRTRSAYQIFRGTARRAFTRTFHTRMTKWQCTSAKTLGAVIVAIPLIACDDQQKQAKGALPQEQRVDTYFRVPKADRRTYGVAMLNRGMDLALHIDARVLLPDAKPDEMGWAGLPDLVVVYSGALPVAPFEGNGRSICNGNLLQVDPYSSTNGVADLPFYFNVSPTEQRHFYASKDGTWIAQCGDIYTTCENRLLNRKWSAKLIVGKTDLCKSRDMNERLVRIVDPWVRQGV